MKTAYELGKEHNKKGYSISYNPYRHRGSADDYEAWKKGWIDEERSKNDKNTKSR